MDHCQLPKDVYNVPYRITMTCIDWLEHMMYVLLLEGDVQCVLLKPQMQNAPYLKKKKVICYQL